MKYKFIVKKSGYINEDFFDFGKSERLISDSMDKVVAELGGTIADYKYNPSTKKIIYNTPTEAGRRIEYEIELVEIPDPIPEPRVKTNVFGLKVKV